MAPTVFRRGSQLDLKNTGSSARNGSGVFHFSGENTYFCISWPGIWLGLRCRLSDCAEPKRLASSPCGSVGL
jgi:hypothetical protein